MKHVEKSTVAEIRERFDRDVERFSNIDTGQTSTVDAAHCMELVAVAASVSTPLAKAVLDVGCGAGNYSLRFRDKQPGARFTLVDLSQPMLKRAEERLGPSAEATYHADIRDLKFNAEQFDVILAAAVLHHLRTPQEWERIISDFYRWLRPGGGLWIFDLVSHENPAIQALMWARYGEYLEAHGGGSYRESVFAYVDREDSPVSLTYQIELMQKVGFVGVDVLHKNSAFAAFGGIKQAGSSPSA